MPAWFVCSPVGGLKHRQEFAPEARRFESGKAFWAKLVGHGDSRAAGGTSHRLAQVHTGTIVALPAKKRKFPCPALLHIDHYRITDFQGEPLGSRAAVDGNFQETT